MSLRTPLYEQLKHDLSRQILAGRLKADSPLMPEGELCAHYKVSRITVRRAVDELVRKRLLYRRRGVGTFVNDAHRQLKMVPLTGYIEDVLPLNQFRLLKTDMAPLPAGVNELVAAAPTGPSRRFICLNHIDGQPFSFASFFFDAETAPFISAQDFRSAESPIRIVELRSGRRVHRAVQRVHPDLATGEAARQLKLRPGTPVLRIVRVYFAVGDVPIQYVEAIYHPERYRVDIELLPRLDAAVRPAAIAAAPATTPHTHSSRAARARR